MTSDWPSTGGPRPRRGGAVQGGGDRGARASTRSSISSGRTRCKAAWPARPASVLLGPTSTPDSGRRGAGTRQRALARRRWPRSYAPSERLVDGRLLSMKGEIDRALELVRGARQMFADAGSSSAPAAWPSEAEIEIEQGDWSKPSESSATGSTCSSESAISSTTRPRRDAREGAPPTGPRSTRCGVARPVARDDRCRRHRQLRVHRCRRGRCARTRGEARRGGSCRSPGRRARRHDGLRLRPPCRSLVLRRDARARRKGRRGEEHAATAMEILDAKGNVMLAARIRERLAAVGLDAV